VNAEIHEQLHYTVSTMVVDTVKQRKLQLFGHICRMDDGRLVKTVMLGMIYGDRPQGRPHHRWIDDVWE